MGYIYKENFERIGRVDPDGYIYGEDLKRLGKIEKDGRIYDNSLKYLGYIDHDGFIYLSNMKRIGRIHKDGFVYDEQLNRVGRLDSGLVDFIFWQNKNSESNSIENQASYSGGDNHSKGDNTGCLWILVGIIAIIMGIFIWWEFCETDNWGAVIFAGTTSCSVAVAVNVFLWKEKCLSFLVGIVYTCIFHGLLYGIFAIVTLFSGSANLLEVICLVIGGITIPGIPYVIVYMIHMLLKTREES